MSTTDRQTESRGMERYIPQKCKHKQLGQPCEHQTKRTSKQRLKRESNAPPGIYPKRPRHDFQGTSASARSLRYHLQQPRYGDDLCVHQSTESSRRGGLYARWSVTRPQKEGTLAACSDRDRPGGYRAERSESDRERQTPCDLAHTRTLETQVKERTNQKRAQIRGTGCRLPARRRACG